MNLADAALNLASLRSGPPKSRDDVRVGLQAGLLQGSVGAKPQTAASPSSGFVGVLRATAVLSQVAQVGRVQPEGHASSGLLVVRVGGPGGFWDR